MSGVADLADAYLSTTDFRLFTREGELDRWLALADACWETRAYGDFWQHMLVAEGVLDLAVDRERQRVGPGRAGADRRRGGRPADRPDGVDTHDGGSARDEQRAAAFRSVGRIARFMTR